MGAPLEETLKRFGEQFTWHPILENAQKLGTHASFIVSGMGGSHLGAWLIQQFDQHLDLTIHRDYGLPVLPETKLRNGLFVASSYSGTTEETLDAIKAAYEKSIHIAAVSLGGDLLDFARAHELPFIQIPDTGLEPRMAIGYSMIALSRFMGNGTLEVAIREGGQKVSPVENRARGLALAERMQGEIPLIWSSARNLPLAYIWKVKFNETAKIPAFCNNFPELNHNEFTGFDVVDSTWPVTSNLHVLMLEDPKDHPRVQRRMSLTKEMLQERKIAVDVIQMRGEHFEKLFSTALFGDWVALGLAQYYGVPNPETPLIAEFKKRIAQS